MTPIGRCSFCGKRADEVFRTITSNGARICSECIGKCADQIADEYRQLAQSIPPNDNGAA